MALPVTIPNTFANATASIPLSQLDTNFNTLANAVNGISDGSETLANASVTVLTAGTVDINGGAIDGTTVGTSNAAAGSFTTLNTSGAVVFNDAGADVDFRVEGDSDANLLFVDASADKVGIGASPSEKLSVSTNGTAQISITNSSGTTKNTQLMFKDNAGSKWRVGMDVATNNNTNIFQIYNDVATAAAMSIDSSGNVGVGVTPSAWSLYRGLQLGSVGSISSSISGQDVLLGSNNFYDGTNNVYIANGFASRYSQFNGAHIWNTAPSGTAGNTITFTQPMTLDASGNLLVGTTSPIAGNECTIYGRNSGSALACYTPGANYGLAVLANGTSYVYFGRGTPGSFSQTGSITNNGTTTTYNTSSDYRLKENVAPMTGALAKVLELNPVTYTWKADGSAGEGFIAHELQEVAPYAVSGEKDGEEMQGVDYGKITPLLTAALQEAIAEIQSLKARVAELEAK